MRPKNSLNELMGSAAAGGTKELSLKDLGDLLGERMPKMEFSPVGRMRLTSALRARFGDNYLHLPGIKKVLDEFDEEARFNIKLQEMKMIKAKKAGK